MQIVQIKTVENSETVLLPAGSAELIRKQYSFDSTIVLESMNEKNKNS